MVVALKMFVQSERKCFWTVIGAGFVVVDLLAQPIDLQPSDLVEPDRHVADAGEASSVDRRSFRSPAPQSILRDESGNPVPDAVDYATRKKVGSEKVLVYL